MKGLLEWVFGLYLEVVQFVAQYLLNVFGMDLAYFENTVPVSKDIFTVAIGVGWALLIGNLVFQAAKSMMSGMGFEGEDPKLLFTRTAVFACLLIFSRSICEIGLGISSTVIHLMQIPDAIDLYQISDDIFGIAAGWVLAMLVNVYLMWQMLKLSFQVGERYVIVAVLTILSPLAFGVGGSKNTMDIFRGWVRMFGSMCLTMVLNIIFLKLLLSAMDHVPGDTMIFPWLILVIALVRVARKIDQLVTRIGLNPAITGPTPGRSLPGMLALMAVRSAVSTVTHTAGGSGGKSAPSGGGARSFGGGVRTPGPGVRPQPPGSNPQGSPAPGPAPVVNEAAHDGQRSPAAAAPA